MVVAALPHMHMSQARRARWLSLRRPGLRYQQIRQELSHCGAIQAFWDPVSRAVGSSPRLSASQMEAESAATVAVSAPLPAARRTPLADGLACPARRPSAVGESYRPDITAILLARQTTSTPAAIIASAPMTTSACHPPALNVTCGAVPATFGTPAGDALPSVTDPAPAVTGPTFELAAEIASALVTVSADTARLAPMTASRRPVSRRASPRLASTAASVATPASARAPAYGTSAEPVTLT